MNGEPLLRERYGALVFNLSVSDLATDVAWYQAISPLLPSLGIVSNNGRLLFQLDPAELKRLLPTSSLIAIQEDTQATKSVVPDVPTPADLCYQRWITLPLHTQLAEVSAALSLNKTQLAEVLDVSRPTIYQWMDEQRSAAEERTDLSRLTTLLRLMAQASISSTEPLNARFTKAPLEIHGKGLLAQLFEKSWDETRVLAGLIQVRGITRAAQRERAERESRLATQGFATASAEEREANLDRTLYLEGLDAP